MILDRMKWMDEVGIDQWNNTEYDKVYPISYFQDHADNGRVFVLINTRSGNISAAAVLKDEDDRWEFPEEKLLDYRYPDSARYLHNFVADRGDKGAGRIFMLLAEMHLRESGISYFRLDSALGNEKLEKYYSDMDFIPVGTCIDGLYTGILRQKELK
ncbi:MAG: hypothetical protein IKV54_06500 [Clostridia bacterium]|nr:hypothetical protein [Clostridia bacterium]